MKTYKRNELNNIFQKELKTITVSEELKNRTLNKIEKQSTFSLYWLRNCAAVLLVSCICLSLYLHQNPLFLKHSNNYGSVEQDAELEIAETAYQDSELDQGKALLKASPPPQSILRSAPKEQINMLQQKSISTETNDLAKQETTTIDNALPKPELNEITSIGTASFFSSTVLEDCTTEESLDEIEIGDSEEQLLQRYPNIEKVENNYRLTAEAQIILYQVENGIITNISMAPLQ
ncbi:MAG: hypothetical protein J6M02_04840 [Clostridia bacterium]|nr:hypothetical protein [Clostridia bacterium]